MREDSPCKGCTERFTACSDRCPKDARGEYGHKAWKERYHAQQKHLEESKNRWYGPWTAHSERIVRDKMKFGTGGRKYGGSDDQ
jgi:hypothetical protein